MTPPLWFMNDQSFRVHNFQPASKIDERELMTSRRGSENFPRDIAIYLIRRYSRKTLTEIGAYFRISNYSTVSSAVGRIKAGKNNNRSLQDHLDSILGQFKTGQK